MVEKMIEKKMNISRGLLGVCMSVFLFAACGGEDPERAIFDESSCPFKLHTSQVTMKGVRQTVRCGNLSVLEARGTPGSKRINVPVVIFLAPTVGNIPVVELAGGPGQSWADLGIDRIDSSFNRQLGRDVIYIEQRGTGLSAPNLGCPELEATSMDAMGASMAPLTACRERLVRSGVDLAGYTTREMAFDLEEMRTTLGYGKIILEGTSYGTAWGLETMRLFPSSLDRVVLDSVLPPQIQFLRSSASGRDGALSALFAACQKDAACNDAFPDLETKLTDTIRALESQPLLWSTVSGGKFTAARYVSTVDSVQMWQPGLVPFFIQTIHKVIQDGLITLDFVDLRIQKLMMSSGTATSSLAIGMYLSVMCGLNQSVTAEDIDADLSQVRPVLRPYLRNSMMGLLAACREWLPTSQGQSELTPVISAVPTMLLAGSLDPRTPVSWAEEAVKTLRRGTLLKFPGLSHSVLSANTQATDLCFNKIFGSFITSGAVSDPSCASQIKPAWILK